MADDPAKDGEPADPFTALADAATSLHAMYEAWVAAGFTPAQATTLTAAVLTAGIGGGS